VSLARTPVTDPDAPGEPEAHEWTLAVRLDDLWQGEMVGLRLGDAHVLLVNLGGGEIRAYDDRCPHAGSLLSAGHLKAATLQCSSHLWEFDLRTGDGVNPRTCRLRSYPVKIVGGDVMVLVPAAPAG
jgi:toluene monooxygenase system ferredoxin subunit